MQEKLWSRNFVLAIGTNLFIYLVFYLLMTSMALYAAQRFLASEAAAGFASSAFIVGALVSRFFAGPLIDNVGRRRILLISLAAFVAVSLLYIPAGSLSLLLALRLVHGVAFGSGQHGSHGRGAGPDSVDSAQRRHRLLRSLDHAGHRDRPADGGAAGGRRDL